VTANDVRPRSSVSLTIAGLALIIVPLLAVAVKFASFGWFMVIALWTLYVPVLLLIGWAMQIVIASTAFFGRRSLLAGRRGATRAITAAWLTSAGVLLVALFFVDGGDTSWGSTFMYWTGTASDHGVGDVSTVLSWIAVIPWIGGWLWLLVEWIVAIVQRGRERRQR